MPLSLASGFNNLKYWLPPYFSCLLATVASTCSTSGPCSSMRICFAIQLSRLYSDQHDHERDRVSCFFLDVYQVCSRVSVSDGVPVWFWDSSTVCGRGATTCNTRPYVRWMIHLLSCRAHFSSVITCFPRIMCVWGLHQRSIAVPHLDINSTPVLQQYHLSGNESVPFFFSPPESAWLPSKETFP